MEPWIPIDSDCDSALNLRKKLRKTAKKCGHKYKAVKIEILHFLGTTGTIVTGAKQGADIWQANPTHQCMVL